jgi:hypothetical protein
MVVRPSFVHSLAMARTTLPTTTTTQPPQNERTERVRENERTNA